MLCRLSVENYALIDQLDIEFAQGLNIITGETGAGKSILLGALGLILGNRAELSVLRDTQRNCVIEAEFDLSGYGLELFFDSMDIDYESRSWIRRVITPGGKSRAYVNDIPVQLSALKEIGQHLIDIHSQHQTLLLADNRFQVDILDSVALQGDLLERYRAVFDALRVSQHQLTQLQLEAEASAKDVEYLSFQLEQLHQAGLIEGEQEELERLQQELTHASEIRDALLYATQTLDADEEGVLTQLKNLQLIVGRLQEVYPRAEEFHHRLHSGLLELRDLSAELSTEGDRIESDPQRLEQVSRRLNLIYSLQQKHKCSTIADLLALQQDYEEQLSRIEGYGEQLEVLTLQLEKQQQEATLLSVSITQGRTKVIPKVQKQVIEALSELGMPAAQLEVEISSAQTLRVDGADQIRYLFTANRNSALQPIEKVASGGEMSRLMLALKALVAQHAQLPTLIFDEIDSGVSGSIADRMGEIIVRLADSLQIINITHLPQVASKGDHHFWVYKEEQQQGTITRMRKLSPPERIDQIAQMLSGSNITPAAREQARLLLGAEQ